MVERRTLEKFAHRLIDGRKVTVLPFYRPDQDIPCDWEIRTTEGAELFYGDDFGGKDFQAIDVECKRRIAEDKQARRDYGITQTEIERAVR